MKKTLIISTILSAAILLTTCDKFLDIKPTGKVIPETAAEYRGLLTQAYNSVPEDRGLVTFRTDEGIMDENISSVSDIDSYKNIWTWEDDAPAGSTVSFGWRQYYHVLFIANYVLENKENITQGTPDEINQLVGEAYMLRAYMHFLLVNLYAEPYTHVQPDTAKGIPLKLNTDTETSLSRNTVEEVYSSIINDLNAAEQHLNVSEWETGLTYRFSKIAVDAFRSRLYLYMGKWEESYNAAQRMLSKKNQLVDLKNSSSPLPNSYKSAENLVSIEQIMTSQYNRAMRISNALLKKYQSGDLRKSKYYKAQTASIYLLKKGGNNEYRCSFRTGEIYLNAAESAFRLQNKDDEGKAFLLKLLEHRLSANAYTKKVLQINSMTNAELLAETLNQRELELAYEGHRWFDLRRLSQPKIEKQFGTENYVLNNNDVRYTLKIPAEAVSANPGLAN